MRLIKSVTSKEYLPNTRSEKDAMGGKFWSDGYFVSSVGKFTSENVIRDYWKNQGKKESYRQLEQNLPKGE